MMFETGEQYMGYPMDNMGYPIDNTGYPMDNTEYPMNNTGYPMNNMGYPMNNTGYPMNNMGYPMDNMGYPGYDMSNYKGPKENYHFDLDQNMMINLGFTQDEIAVLQNVVAYYGIVTRQKLSTPPFIIPNQVIISRLMYAYNICMGKVVIDMDDPISLAKHFKKLHGMGGGHSTFSAFHIPHRNIIKVPRVAVVAGLPKGNFYVLNSLLYDKMEATYRVEKIAQEWVTIYSDRTMCVGAQDRLNNSYENKEWGIPDILKVEEVGSRNENKPWKIKIHKKNCRLCNRFLIVASTKKMVPGVTEHHGCYCLITSEGDIVYVYARTTDFDSYGNPKDSVPNTTRDTVILDYGFYRSEIENKLTSAVNAVASKWQIVYSKRLDGETPYNEIPKYSGMEQIRGAVETETTEYNPDHALGID